VAYLLPQTARKQNKRMVFRVLNCTAYSRSLPQIITDACLHTAAGADSLTKKREFCLWALQMWFGLTTLFWSILWGIHGEKDDTHRARD
jgi:hypothetical protein